MKIRCPRCKQRPRPTRHSMYCCPCEREYRAERQEATRAKHRKHNAKRRADRKRQDEDKIQWWMNLSGEALQNVLEEYRRKNKPLPKEYQKAMNRIARARRKREVEHLASLSPKLAQAALRFRKANARGNQVRDARRYYENNPHF